MYLRVLQTGQAGRQSHIQRELAASSPDPVHEALAGESWGLRRGCD